MPFDDRPDHRPDQRRRLVVVLATLVVALVIAGLVADSPRTLAAAPPSPVPPSTVAPTTTIFNDFIPEDANLTDCISALPGPNCGSSARGGWRQTLVFVVIIAAVVVIGTRIVIAVRRRDRDQRAG